MRAAVRRGTGDLSIEDVDAVDTGDDDVLIRVRASGVCHSDLHFLETELGPLPPVVLGHEGAGVVEEVGSHVTGLSRGDRVITNWAQPCGNCAWCLRGQSYACSERVMLSPAPRWRATDGSGLVGMGGLGTFADVVITSPRALVKVDTDLPDDQLALIGCGVTTGVCAAINAAAVAPGSSVAVLGCGGVGQSVIQGARVCGATQVIAVDPVAEKRDAALRFGATDAVDSSAGGVPDTVKELTGGVGVDYAFEVAGRRDSLQAAYEVTRRGGRLVLLGTLNPGESAEWDIHDQVTDSKTVVGALYGHANVQRDFAQVVRLVESSQLDLASMVSARIGLDDLPDALEAMARGQGLRSVVTF